MSTTVDQRIVEMRFDNQHFEKNVSTTMSTLEKLKSSLNFNGAVKGIEQVENISRHFNLSGITSAVETVQSKFTAMEIMAITAISNLTNSAINAGKKIVKALTIDPIKTGFQEYETQINSVQTILANTSSKGTTIDQVNKALDELNEYADKTIYNFTQMTRNIGTFTAAGVDLETSVSAIKGIANLAAVSGSTSQQASTAMYQLSQALASGTVKLQDWNSVVNAGMGGQVFQDALKRTAKVMGTDVDALIKKYGSFRESLSQGGWLTTEVLTKTLNQFTMAAEEGTEQWEAYKKSLMEEGYTEAQAIEILKMANTATDAATKVKTFTQLWDTLKESVQSGWSQSWEIVVGDFEEAKELLTEVSDVLGGMIGASAQARNAMLQMWKDLGGRKALIDGVKNAFEGIMNIVKPVSEAFREIFPPLTGKQLFDFTEGFRKLTEQFKIFTSEHAGNVKNAFKGLFSILGLIKDGFFAVINAIKPLGALIGDLANSIFEASGSFGEYLVGVAKSVKESGFFTSVLDGLTNAIKTVISWFKPLGFIAEVTGNILEGLGKIALALLDALKKLAENAFGITNGFNLQSITDLFSTGVFAGMVVTLKKLVKGFDELKDPITNFFGTFEDLKKNVSDVISNVTESLKAFQGQLKADTLMKLATAIAILAASLAVLALIDEKRLSSALTGISIIFIELIGSLYVLEKLSFTKSGLNSLNKLVKPMIGLSVAVLILASAMAKMAKLDWDGVIRGLIGVAGTATVLVLATKELSKNTGKITKTSIGLIAFATAINVLANAVKTLGSIHVNDMIQGLLGVGGLLAALAIFSKNVDSAKFKMSSATGILILSGAINLLAIAVKQFAGMDDYGIVQGLLAVGLLLGEVAIFTNSTKNASNVISTSIGLTILAAAMKIFASVINDLGVMKWDDLLQGLAGMATALGIIGLAGHAMSGTIAGSSSMLIMAAALAILTPQLLLLSSMDSNELGMGLLVLASSFAVLGAAGYVLGPLVPTLIGLAGAVALFGLGAAAVGVGILAFSAGLSALSVSGVAAAGSLSAIIAAIIGLIPLILVQLANGIVALCEVITRGAPAIAEAIVAIVVAVIDVLVKSIPPLVKGVLEILTSVLTTLVEFLPKLMDAGAKLVIAILKGIADNITLVVQKGIEIIVNFINGVASMIGKVIDAGINLIVNFINGLAEGIRKNGPAFVDAVWNLFTAIIETAIYILTSSISGITNVGGKIMEGLKQGISTMFTPIVNAVKNIINGAIDAIKGFISNFKSVGSSVIQGLVNGISGGFSSVVNAATNVVSGAWNAAKSWLGINSPSRAFAELGKYSDLGFAQGLDNYAKVVNKSAEDVGDGALNSLSNSLADINLDLIDDQPVIKPVLDMSAVTAGANTLNDLFANNPAFALGANVNTGSLGGNISAVSSMSKNIQNGSNADVVNALGGLRSDVSDLAEAISNMQLSMDGDTVVGSLITKIDNRLGRISTYKGRSN